MDRQSSPLLRPLLLALAVFVAAPAAMAQNEPLTVLVFHRPPYYVVGKGRHFGGFLLDYTKNVLDAAHIPFRFAEAPPKRILKTLEEGASATCAVGWFKTAEREAYARFSDPIFTGSPMGVAVRTERIRTLPHAPTADALLRRGMRLGLRQGFSYGDWLDAKLVGHRNAADLTVAENDQLLEMIARGRIDYTFIGPEEYDWLVSKHPELRKKIRFMALGGIPPETPRHIMCGKNTPPEIVERINEAIRSLPPPVAVSIGPGNGRPRP
ncbi:substrate-binding periplasmic protein [Desulfolutivibrio sp.]|uniref:substrate-binding periplasmic protein n=1 Tax=Desulfolutivibrio sp. TaxID=2773296 RepID=UPI002F96442A